MNSLLRSSQWYYQRGKRNLGGSKTSPSAKGTIAAIRHVPCCVRAHPVDNVPISHLSPRL